MIRKRRSLSSERSPKEVAPVSRAWQAKPPVRRRAVSRGKEEEQVLQTSQVQHNQVSKQELILAHVHARRQQGVKPQARFWVAVTVVAAALVVLVGWWMTFGRSVQDVSLESDGLFQMVGERSRDLKQEVGSPVEGMKQQLEEYQAQHAAQSVLLQQMALEAANRQATGTATGTR